MWAKLRHGAITSTLVTCWLCLSGCHGTVAQLANERLDRTTGVTLLTADEPIVFARTEGQYSRSARDYLYLGPVETNRQGTREYYLWVGIATTLDRGFLAPESATPATLLVEIQGEPMYFELEPWSHRVPNLEPVPLYETAVDTGIQLAARVTMHQLALLAGESLESVRVGNEAGDTRLYRRWRQGRDWHGFVREALALESIAPSRLEHHE